MASRTVDSTQMLVVAVGFQVYDVTRNPLDLGLVGLSQFLPFVLLILPAGHVADRYDRRHVQRHARVRAAAHRRDPRAVGRRRVDSQPSTDV